YWFQHGMDLYAGGLHGGSGNHSSVLLTLMPCVAMSGWYANRAGWPRALQWMIAGIAVTLFVSAYTTLNRTIWLGFALQFALMGALLLWRHKFAASPLSTREKVIAAALAIALASGGTAIMVRVQAEREAQGAQTMEKDPRLNLWPHIFERIEARPLTGYGFGRGMLRKELFKEVK